MAFHSGAFNIGTGAVASTVAITGAGFTPKAAIFWWSGRTESTNAGGSSSYIQGMGFATASANVASVGRETDGIGTSDNLNASVTNGCILELSSTAITGIADLQSFDADGCTLEIIDQFATDLRISYVLVGGSDVTDVEVGSFTGNGSAGSQSVDFASAFQPDIVFFLNQADADGSVSSHNRFGHGVAIDSTHEFCYAARSSDASGTGVTNSYCRGGECIAVITNADTMGNRAEFTSRDSDGFTINWLEVFAVRVYYYLGIKGGQWHVGSLTTATDTTPFAVTGVGFQPEGLIVVSAGNAESTSDTADAGLRWSVGAATSTSNRTAQSVGARDGNTNMFTQCFLRTDAIYVNHDLATDTITGLMDLDSLDGDGFTAVMDDADTSGAFAWFVAAATASAGGALPWLYRSHTQTLGAGFQRGAL